MQEVLKLSIENMHEELKKKLIAPPLLSIPIDYAWVGEEGLEIPDHVINLVKEKIGKRWFFAKLSTRSPKDYFATGNGDISPMRHIEDFVDAFCGASMRVFDDICEGRHCGLPLYIHVLPWINIEPNREWRCFIRNSKLIAASQYFYNLGFVDLQFSKEKIISQVNDYLPYIEEKDVVIDIVLGKGLLELNPYGLSDPCLFSYEELDNINNDDVVIRHNKVTLCQ